MSVKKRALILGNGAYGGDFLLKSPKNDAERMASSLGSLDFHVTMGLDLDHDRMSALVDEFIKSLDADRPHVTLFYYSGHGLQIKDENFLVPLDFDDRNTIKLIRVQDVVDEISEFSELQIVLLDACRSNFDNQQVLHSKAMRLDKDKAIYIGGVAEPVSGLAEMRASSSTFIAFAAAPGDVAYEGGNSLSPFTAAFVKYVDAIDLPLSNLMSRVRQEVLKTTHGRQRTWDQSSLMAPFYFNPGSIFLFMGNALALVALFLSLLPYSLVLTVQNITWGWFAASALLPMITLAILMLGMQSVYSRLHGNFQSDSDKEPGLWEHLIVCLQKGSLGGYLSALIAALAITYFYYQAWTAAFGQGDADRPEPFGMIAVEITITAIFVACILGFLSLFFARVSLGPRGLKLSHDFSAFRMLAGAAAGGILAGIVCAPFIMLHFAPMLGRPQMTPNLLLPGAILGTAFIIFAIVNFDFERLSPRRLAIGGLSAVVAVLIGGIVAAALFGPLYKYGVVQLVIDWIKKNLHSDAHLLAGGAVYGIPVGFVLGLVIGIAIVLTGRWSAKPIFSSPVTSSGPP